MMDRRNFLKGVMGGSMGLMVWNGFSGYPKMDFPNLLIIYTDQLSCWALSAYSGTHLSTPHIDSLANEGVLFLNYFTNSAVCTPSRGCFLTGRYPHAHGAYKNNIPMNLDEITFAQILKDNGYETGYAGKWHLDGPRRPGWVNPDRAFGFTDNYYMYNRGHWKKIEDSPMQETDPVIYPYKVIGNETSYPTDWLTSKTIDFINKPRKVPFCYMVSYPDPHTPFTVRKPYNTMYNPGSMSFPISVPQELHEKLAKLKSQYLGEVKCIDDNVGKIIDALKRGGIYDNTIVVFTTDHGEYMGEHGLMGKNQIYETAIHIPLIIRWPQKIKAGMRIKNILSTVDFQRTILSLMDYKSSGREQGRDASPLLFDKQLSWEDVAHIHHSSLERVHIFTAEFELAYTNRGKNGYLFDRINDPFQMKNLFLDSQYNPVVRKLTDLIFTHHREVNSPAIKWLQNLYDVK
jgi:arylsulfatase A-like enzyme